MTPSPQWAEILRESGLSDGMLYEPFPSAIGALDVPEPFIKALDKSDGELLLEIGAVTPDWDLDGESLDPTKIIVDYSLKKGLVLWGHSPLDGSPALPDHILGRPQKVLEVSPKILRVEARMRQDNPLAVKVYEMSGQPDCPYSPSVEGGYIRKATDAPGKPFGAVITNYAIHHNAKNPGTYLKRVMKALLAKALSEGQVPNMTPIHEQTAQDWGVEGSGSRRRAAGSRCNKACMGRALRKRRRGAARDSLTKAAISHLIEEHQHDHRGAICELADVVASLRGPTP